MRIGYMCKYCRSAIYLDIGQSPLLCLLPSVKAECHVKLHRSTGRSVGYATQKLRRVNEEKDTEFPVVYFKNKTP